VKITIAGYGYVGKAMHELLKSNYDISIVDPIINNTTIAETNPEAVIICVSTPQGLHGECDVSNVIQVIDDTPTNVPILIKSTISLEGWQEIIKCPAPLRVSFSPEFLRAKTAIEDCLNSTTMYIGHGGTAYWSDIFLKAKPNLEIKTYDVKELILAKYFRNSFLATKVSFFNQIFDLCKKMNIDYEPVRQVITDDKRIGGGHSLITDERGFGGHCFPKDTNAISETAKLYGSELTIIDEAIYYNKIIKSRK
tara:strand:- start:4255 stop:5010 length:756 start_codon:yes stop_codon:yes gene_type:complete